MTGPLLWPSGTRFDDVTLSRSPQLILQNKDVNTYVTYNIDTFVSCSPKPLVFIGFEVLKYV